MTYPYTEHSPLGTVEWFRELPTAPEPVELGRALERGKMVWRRKGLRNFAKGEIEGVCFDQFILEALLAPPRPWHYVTEPERPQAGRTALIWFHGESGPSFFEGKYDPDEDGEGWDWFEEATGERFRSGPERGRVFAWQPEPEPPPLPEGGR